MSWMHLLSLDMVKAALLPVFSVASHGIALKNSPCGPRSILPRLGKLLDEGVRPSYSHWNWQVAFLALIINPSIKPSDAAIRKWVPLLVNWCPLWKDCRKLWRGVSPLFVSWTESEGGVLLLPSRMSQIEQTASRFFLSCLESCRRLHRCFKAILQTLSTKRVEVPRSAFYLPVFHFVVNPLLSFTLT